MLKELLAILSSLCIKKKDVTTLSQFDQNVGFMRPVSHSVIGISFKKKGELSSTAEMLSNSKFCRFVALIRKFI